MKTGTKSALQHTSAHHVREPRTLIRRCPECVCHIASVGSDSTLFFRFVSRCPTKSVTHFADLGMSVVRGLRNKFPQNGPLPRSTKTRLGKRGTAKTATCPSRRRKMRLLRAQRKDDGCISFANALELAARRLRVGVGLCPNHKELMVKCGSSLRSGPLRLGQRCVAIPRCKRRASLFIGTVCGWQNRRLTRGKRWIFAKTRGQERVFCFDAECVWHAK